MIKELDLSKVKPEEIEHFDGERILSVKKASRKMDTKGEFIVMFEGGSVVRYDRKGHYRGLDVPSIRLKPKTITYVKSMLEILTEFPDTTFPKHHDATVIMRGPSFTISCYSFPYLGGVAKDPSIWPDCLLKEVTEPTG